MNILTIGSLLNLSTGESTAIATIGVPGGSVTVALTPAQLDLLIEIRAEVDRQLSGAGAAAAAATRPSVAAAADTIADEDDEDDPPLRLGARDDDDDEVL